jgi:hypothetical protein
MVNRARVRPRSRLPAGVALGLTGLLATGCGTAAGSSGESPASSSASGTVSPSAATPSASPSTVSGSGSPAPSGSASASSTASGSPVPTTLRGRLLPAAQLPARTDGSRWAEATTRREDPSTSLSTCQRFSVTAIGAEHVWVRTFRPARAGSAERAGELVAQLPDAATARRAYAVLESWRATCQDRLAPRVRARVGALQDVPVPGGTAGWYVVTVRGAARTHEETATVRVGARIAMVDLRLDGRPGDHPAGQEPAVLAVQQAAERLR